MLVRRGLLCSRRLVACPNASEEGCGSSGHATSCSPSSCYCATYASTRGFGFGLGLEPLPPPPRPPPLPLPEPLPPFSAFAETKTSTPPPFGLGAALGAGADAGADEDTRAELGATDFDRAMIFEGGFAGAGVGTAFSRTCAPPLSSFAPGAGADDFACVCFAAFGPFAPFPPPFPPSAMFAALLSDVRFPLLAPSFPLEAFGTGWLGRLDLDFVTPVTTSPPMTLA